MKGIDNFRKNIFVNRFIWECYNGLIPVGKVIFHKTKIIDDNCLCNLKLMTFSEMHLKLSADIDRTGFSLHLNNPKCVKAVNCNTKKNYTLQRYPTVKIIVISFPLN